jgi:putative membrane protein
MWMMILWWIIIIIAVAALIKFVYQKESSGQKSALDILKERYARGEISKEEFQEKKRDIIE